MFDHKELNIPGYFLCYYIPSKKDTTIISSLLIDFKNNSSIDIVDELCEWACSELSKKRIKINIIVRALNSSEVKATLKTSLDRLGNKLAESLNAIYKPEILKKTRMTYPLKRIELEERKTEVKNVYYLDYTDFSNEDSILIIDDIYTTGATISEIIRSLRIENSKMKIYCFTLGKVVFQNNINETVLPPDFIYKYNQNYPDVFEDMVMIYKKIKAKRLHEVNI